MTIFKKFASTLFFKDIENKILNLSRLIESPSIKTRKKCVKED